MTVGELEHFAGLVPGPDEVAETVIALIADWQAMREYLWATELISWQAAYVVANLKVKP